jgi:hypothetical protein
MARMLVALVVMTARSNLAIHGTEQPENRSDYRKDDAEDPQDVDVQQQSEDQPCPRSLHPARCGPTAPAVWCGR